MNNEDATIMVKYVHVGLRTTFWIYGTILLVWLHFSLVGDFGQGLFHVSFWAALEIVFIMAGMSSIGYGISTLQGHPEIDTEDNVKYSKFCTFLAFCMAAKNITHVGFVSAELSGGTTMLAAQYYWYLVLFLVLLLLLIILDFVAIYHFYHYRIVLRIYAATHKSKKYP